MITVAELYETEAGVLANIAVSQCHAKDKLRLARIVHARFSDWREIVRAKRWLENSKNSTMQ